MDACEIDVPALLFSPGFETVEFISEKTILSITNKLGLKHGVVLGNTIVDSSGTAYKTIGATRKSNVNPWWEFEFFNPMICVELRVEKAKSQLELSELKKKILSIIGRDEDEWANYEEDVERIKQAVSACPGHRELIKTIGGYIDLGR